MTSPRDTPRQHLDVVIAVLVREGRVLISQRRQTDPMGGYWEFPGGKREPGETDLQCIQRELKEELAITAGGFEPLPPFEHDYPHAQVRVQPFWCELSTGTPQPLAAQALAWVAPEELQTYRFLPANASLIRTILARLAGV